MRSIAALLLAVVLVGACSGSGMAADDGRPADPCEFGAVTFAIGPAICAQAVALAEARLGWLHWPVTSIQFRTSMCPPNARCAVAFGDQGWVIFEFLVGDPVMVHVGPPVVGDVVVTNELVADAPQPVPDWLRDELRQDVDEGGREASG